jgi:hypothetical protein
LIESINWYRIPAPAGKLFDILINWKCAVAVHLGGYIGGSGGVSSR